MNIKQTATLAACVVTMAAAAFAQDGSTSDTSTTEQNSSSSDDLAKELSNPNTPLSSLVFKQTYTTFDGTLPGAGDQSSVSTLFQPVFPFPLQEGGTTNLFVRPAIAYVTRQPVFNTVTGQFENKSGWADIGFDVAIGKTYESGLVTIAGIQGTIPTNSDVSGGQWRLGPEALVARIYKKGYWAIFPSHQWDVGGRNYDYSTTQLEIFGGFYLPNAWTIYTDSKLSYDWVNDQATIPINLSVSKVTKIGNLPVKFSAGVDYYAKSNDAFGQDWSINFSISPVVKNFIYDWIKG